METRSLDVLADDLPPHHMRGDDMHHALPIHPIIQSCRAARARECGKPTAQRWHCIAAENLSDQDIGSLRAAPEAALPLQLRVLLRAARVERAEKHVVERGGSMAVTALGTAADHDLEAP